MPVSRDLDFGRRQIRTGSIRILNFIAKRITMPQHHEPPLLDSWASALGVILCSILHVITLFVTESRCMGPLCGLEVVAAIGVCAVAWLINLALTAVIRAKFKNADTSAGYVFACLLAAVVPFAIAWFRTRGYGDAAGSRDYLFRVIWPAALYPAILLWRIINIVARLRSTDEHKKGSQDRS